VGISPQLVLGKTRSRINEEIIQVVVGNQWGQEAVQAKRKFHEPRPVRAEFKNPSYLKMKRKTSINTM